jgi:hypothetical protein
LATDPEPSSSPIGDDMVLEGMQQPGLGAAYPAAPAICKLSRSGTLQ